MRAACRALCVLATACLASACTQGDPVAEERGFIVASSPIDQAGENTGAGAVAGIAVGAALGGRFGGQAGIAVASALAGGVTGAAAEGAAQSHDGVAYTVRLREGRVVTVIEHHAPSAPLYAPGTQVTVQTRGAVQHVVATTGA